MKIAPELLVFKWATALFASMWLSVPEAMKLLMLVFVMEFISALLNPEVKIRRVVKTIVGSLILTSMVQIGYFYVTLVTKLNVGFDIVAAVCLFYGFSAIVDIMLNFNAAGIPIPPVLLDFLGKAKGLTGKERSDLKKLNNYKQV